MWIQLETKHVLGAMTQKEIDALNGLFPGTLSTTRLDEVLQQVTKEVRLAVGSCTQNKLTIDAALIPEEFVFQAVAIARFRFCSVLPNYDSGGMRRKEYEEATSYLRDIAKCIFRPAPASQPTLSGNDAVPEVEQPHGAQVIGDVPIRAGRKNMSGL